MGVKRFKVKSVGRKSGLINESITTVDEEDAYLLRNSYWTVQNSTREVAGKVVNAKYVLRRTQMGVEYLHYVIAGAKNGERVAHINGDSLDNRRANLLRNADRVEEITDDDSAGTL